MLLTAGKKDLWTSRPVYLSTKKKVDNAYTPNSYRIFQDEITDKNVINRASSSQTSSRSKLLSINSQNQLPLGNNKPENYWGGDQKISDLGLQSLPGFIPSHPKEPTRRNCPHPPSANFLRSNVAILNDAIPSIRTNNVDINKKWWQHQSHGDGLQNHRKKSIENLRKSKLDFTKLPEIQKAALNARRQLSKPPTSDWILRHNTLDDRRFRERISYRHGYNRRFSRHEPIRGKLPGNFVWEELKKSRSAAS